MKTYIMTEAENSLAELIWEKEPIKSGALVTLCGTQLNWKKSTTYTVLKKLCENGLFQNQDSLVTSLLSKEEYVRRKGERYLEENYDGSLPAFVAAFMRNGKLKSSQIQELRRLIEDYEEE